MAGELQEVQRLTMLVHGASKAGKSTLTSTAPKPILVLDAEGSWGFIRQEGYRSGIPLRKKQWNPMYAPPRHDGTWEVCYVAVNTWEQLKQVYAWITQAEHDFQSIVLDSVTELQRKLKDNIASDGVIKGYDGWGRILADMERIVRGFRDLVHAPGSVRCVVLVAETRMDNGKWRPTMQGQIKDHLPYLFDLVGYLFQTMESDSDGNPTVPTVNLFIGSHPQFESGERVQGALPFHIVDPHISKMIKALYEGEESNV